MTGPAINAMAPSAFARELWLRCKTEAARQAVLDTYRKFLTDLNGNEAAAAELTRAWASLMKRDFPGMPPVVYTAASLQEWAEGQLKAFGEGVV